ncbi:MAG TPA: S41 family peptidase [Longimicrobiales bacterium]|nr:S41 family peptidase [Longimicrobiales bacterium]
MVLSLVVPAVTGGWVLRDLAPVNGARLFAQVLEHVREHAVSELSEDAAYEAAARGLVEQLNDPYADLWSPEQLARYQREELRGSYGGLGMLIQDQNGAITVTQVFPHSPAESGGVAPGDRILAVNGERVTGMRIDSVSSRLLGTIGTSVEVAFGREGVAEPIVGTFERASVRQPTVPFAIVLDGGVGYIPLQRFSDSAAREVFEAVGKVRAEGATSLVLDLRGNGGGSLDNALQIADFFLDPGQPLATVRYRGRADDVYLDRAPAVVPAEPVIVLVDQYSASATEIVAGALQDHDRAVVMGATTFGKGLVQEIYRLDGGWAMKLTVGQWYTPSGRLIQRERDASGVEKDTLPLAERPRFQSTRGRVVYGGGGITPDLHVASDTVTTPEFELLKTLGAQTTQLYVAVFEQARSTKGTVAPGFEIAPEWREAVYRKLVDGEATVTRAQFDAARPLVDRLLQQRVTALAFGDSAAYRTTIGYDAPVRAALELLRAGPSQQELFALVEKREKGASD